jgi:hypothetical protein
MPRPPNEVEGRPPRGPANRKLDGDQGFSLILTAAVDIPVEIRRGPAGDCCILCGRVGIDLPVEHGCIPNLSAEDLAQLEADRRRPRRSWWSS